MKIVAGERAKFLAVRRKEGPAEGGVQHTTKTKDKQGKEASKGNPPETAQKMRLFRNCYNR